MTAYTPADVAALTSVTCRKQHGLGAPEWPCYGCRAAAERVLDVVAEGIAARAKRDAAVDLADRLGRARDVLNGRARDAEGFERFRLDGKANGVALALSYVEEITRSI